MAEDPEGRRPVEGLRCPTCGARQAWTDTCRRCKSDLRLLREALAAYQRHRRCGLRDLQSGRLGSALRHARRCQELRPGPESRRLLVVCQLLRGDWLEAVDLARTVDAAGTETDH
ncbi:MAG TPA: hypothetical protein VFF52_16010 [Isosphaeraceae bacterium]|nr:hypothetical protein [Isosphaeraceae bacterium]